MIKPYVKILPMVGKHLDLIMGQEVEVTEKLDGSQFCFGKDLEGKLHIRSKGAIIDAAAPPAMFAMAVAHVHMISHRIPNNTVFYSETLNKPRHNSLTYDRIPKNGIALYGITDFFQTEALSDKYKDLSEWAETLEVEAVPLLFHGKLENLDEVKKYMEGVSVLGTAIKEGVVVKNYNQKAEFNGQVYPLTALKYVSENFKEVHSSNPDWTPAKDKRLELMESYRTEARWLKAVQRLKEQSNVLEGIPKDIGQLIPSVIKDVVEEEKENFKEELFKIHEKDWKSTMVRGLPEWYKQYLLENI